MASEAGTAAAAKKKKNKGRKGAQPAAAQATQPAADTAEAGEEGPEEQEREQEDELALLGRLQAQRKQQAAEAGAVAAAPAVPAEQQEGYQRMLREYEEAQRAQKMKQAAKPAVQQAAGRSSSQASASTTSAPHQAAAAVADTASSTGSGAAAAGGDTLAAELDAAEVDGERQHSLAALQAASQAFDWSMIEGADADASPHGDAEPAPADWQDAPSHRPAPAKARLAAEAAAASTDSWQGKPAVVDQTEQQAEQQTVAPHRAQQQQQRSAIDPNKPRVVGWDGAWVCKCGKRHSVSEACKACKAPVPCRWGAVARVGVCFGSAEFSAVLHPCLPDCRQQLDCVARYSATPSYRQPWGRICLAFPTPLAIIAGTACSLLLCWFVGGRPHPCTVVSAPSPQGVPEERLPLWAHLPLLASPVCAGPAAPASRWPSHRAGRKPKGAAVRGREVGKQAPQYSRSQRVALPIPSLCVATGCSLHGMVAWLTQQLQELAL